MWLKNSIILNDYKENKKLNKKLKSCKDILIEKDISKYK